MVLSELVLKVPTSEVTTSRPPPHTPQHQQPSTSKLKKKGKSNNNKTHSRESSGASNLSVRFTVNDETVSTDCRPAASSTSAELQPNQSEEEDITLSDRLSQDLGSDDGFHPGSKSCESIPHDRLTPYSEDGGMR